MDNQTSRLAKTMHEARRGGQRFSSAKCHIAVAHDLPPGCGLGIDDLAHTAVLMAACRLLRSQEDCGGGAQATGACVSETQMRAQRSLNGGAVRSLVGGVVRLGRGYREDGKDCFPVPVFDADHWPELVVLAVVPCGAEEPPRGAHEAAMRRGVDTSALLSHRAGVLAPARVQEVETALGMRDFPRLAVAVTADSNQCVACAMDTSPPAIYLSSSSHKIIAMIERINLSLERVAVAYSFGAGPGALLLTTEADLPMLLWRLLYHFPPDAGVDLGDYCDDRELLLQALAAAGSAHVVAAEAATDAAVRAAIRDMHAPPEVFPRVFQFVKRVEAASRYGDTPVFDSSDGLMRWPGMVEALLLASPGRCSEILEYPGAHHLGARTGLPGMRAEQTRRKTAMLEGERRAAAAAAAAMEHTFEHAPLPLYTTPASAAALLSASGGFGVGRGLAPGGGLAREEGRGGDCLTAHEALSAALPPDAPPMGWINTGQLPKP